MTSLSLDYGPCTVLYKGNLKKITNLQQLWGENNVGRFENDI